MVLRTNRVVVRSVLVQRGVPVGGTTHHRLAEIVIKIVDLCESTTAHSREIEY